MACPADLAADQSVMVVPALSPLAAGLFTQSSQSKALARFSADLQFSVDLFSGLVEGSDGLLHGTTYFGGVDDGTTFSGGGPVYGTVFRIKPVALRGGKAVGGFTVHLEGFAGHRYAVDAADSLPPMWNQVTTLTNTTGTVAWSDITPAGDGRCYRARVLNP